MSLFKGGYPLRGRFAQLKSKTVPLLSRGRSALNKNAPHSTHRDSNLRRSQAQGGIQVSANTKSSLHTVCWLPTLVGSGYMHGIRANIAIGRLPHLYSCLAESGMLLCPAWAYVESQRSVMYVDGSTCQVRWGGMPGSTMAVQVAVRPDHGKRHAPHVPCSFSWHVFA